MKLRTALMAGLLALALGAEAQTMRTIITTTPLTRRLNTNDTAAGIRSLLELDTEYLSELNSNLQALGTLTFTNGITSLGGSNYFAGHVTVQSNLYVNGEFKSSKLTNGLMVYASGGNLASAPAVISSDALVQIAQGTLLLYGATNASLASGLKLTASTGITLTTNGQNLEIASAAGAYNPSQFDTNASSQISFKTGGAVTNVLVYDNDTQLTNNHFIWYNAGRLASRYSTDDMAINFNAPYLLHASNALTMAVLTNALTLQFTNGLTIATNGGYLTVSFSYTNSGTVTNYGGTLTNATLYGASTVNGSMTTASNISLTQVTANMSQAEGIAGYSLDMMVPCYSLIMTQADDYSLEFNATLNRSATLYRKTEVFLFNQSGYGFPQTLAFNSSWTWMTSVPATITNNTWLHLTLYSTGNNESNIMASAEGTGLSY